MNWDSCYANPKRDSVWPLVVRFVVKIELKPAIPKVYSSDPAFDVPDPRSGEEIDQSIYALTTKVENSTNECQFETLLCNIDITVQDSDDIIIRVLSTVGARGGAAITDHQGRLAHSEKTSEDLAKAREGLARLQRRKVVDLGAGGGVLYDGGWF